MKVPTGKQQQRQPPFGYPVILGNNIKEQFIIKHTRDKIKCLANIFKLFFVDLF